MRASFSHLGFHRTHHAEIRCVVRQINYALFTGNKWRISASAQVQLNVLFKHICPLQLVHRPEGVLLAIMNFLFLKGIIRPFSII